MSANINRARMAVRLQRRQKYALGPALHALRALVSAGLDAEAGERAAEYAQTFGASADAGRALLRLAREAPIRQFAAEQVIIAEGEPATSMFVIVRGRIRLERRRVGVLAQLAVGQSFGEVALFSGTTRTATAVANGGASVLELSQDALDQVRTEIPAITDVLERVHRDRVLAQFVGEDALFSSLERHERHALFARFAPKGEGPGTLLLCQGEAGREFSVLISGQVKVWRSGPNGVETLATLGPGDFFGEIALLDNIPVTANVQTLTPIARLVLDRSDFHQVMGAHPEQYARLQAVAQQRLSGGELTPSAEARSPVDAFEMTCPSCAYEQPRSPVCTSCGASVTAAREFLKETFSQAPRRVEIED